MNKKHYSLDDIVFENKNKAYGAYYNRLTAGFDLMKSLFVTILGVGILALILSFTVNEEDKTPEPHRVTVIVDPTVGLPPEKDKKVETVEKDKPAPKVKTIKSDKTTVTPTPTKAPEKQTAMQDNEDLSKVNIGDQDIDGDDNNSIKTPQGNGEEGGTGTGSDNGESSDAPKQPEKTIFLPRDVTQMAVFPGCEKHAGNKKKLESCLSEQLQKELGNQLTDFNEIANRQGINEAVAKVNFVIDKSGKIIEVKTVKGGNVELSKESKEALERISKRLIQKGKYIQPAKFEDGTPVNLMFTIPVKFISN